MIKRPNYQRTSAQKRLLAFDLETAGNRTQNGSERIQGGSVQPAEDTTAALRVAGLSAIDGQTVRPRTAQAHEAVQYAPVHAGEEILIFEKPDQRVARLLKMYLKTGDAIGLAHAAHSTFAQLWAVDKAQTDFSSVNFSVQWDENPAEPFTALCTGRPDAVKAAMEIIRAGINSGTGIYTSLNPSYLILQKLRLAPGQVIGIDGVDYLHSIAFIQQFYEDNPGSSLEFIPKERFLLARGPLNEAEAALNSFLNRLQRTGGGR